VKDLCEKNPALNICQNSTLTGTCGTITCTGDAITCEIAKQAAKANCDAKQREDELKASGQYKLGNDALGGNDPLASTLPNKDKPEEINIQSSLDSSGFLGGGACIPDTQFSVSGQQISIPWSKACEYLVGLRAALMVMAFMMAFRMLSGTILRE
jgi:hypothetical protein